MKCSVCICAHLYNSLFYSLSRRNSACSLSNRVFLIRCRSNKFSCSAKVKGQVLSHHGDWMRQTVRLILASQHDNSHNRPLGRSLVTANTSTWEPFCKELQNVKLESKQLVSFCRWGAVSWLKWRLLQRSYSTSNPRAHVNLSRCITELDKIAAASAIHHPRVWHIFNGKQRSQKMAQSLIILFSFSSRYTHYFLWNMATFTCWHWCVVLCARAGDGQL